MTQNDHRPLPAWFDISSPDAARARGFYTDLFGWPCTVLDESYALVGTDGGRPTGGIGQAGPDSPYVGMVAYFPVDDVDAALERAEQLGGTRVLAPVDTPMSRIAVFADPDGNRVGLVTPQTPDPH